jgi:ketosteroid isomerase-like protein
MNRPRASGTSGTSAEARIERVRAGMEAYNAGDIETVLSVFADDIEIYAPQDFLNAGTFHGHDGFLRWVSAWNEAWESFEIDVDAIEPVGQRHVVAEVHQRARGRGSGIDIDQRVAYVYELRDDGKCSFQGIYPEAEQAYAVAREREAAPAD